MTKPNGVDAYWRSTLGLLTRILVVWFVVSYGAGILFVEQLNQIAILGYALGFWVVQQGSICMFFILTFYFARKMVQLDREHGVQEK